MLRLSSRTWIFFGPSLKGIRFVPCCTLSTSAGHDASKIRNMALVAHIDSGKTTLTESILLKSEYLSTVGTVDTGSTTTDFLPAERERGITIQSASIPVKWKDWTFNLIDTPGHADFGMEVESASRVVDGAVVLIDSVEGVEAQTKGVWTQLDRYKVPTRIVFLNKLDRPGASFKSSLSSLLLHRLHPKPVALTLPIASFDPDHYSRAEPGIQGLVDLIKWELWKWGPDGESTHPLPRDVRELDEMDIIPSSHPILPHLAMARKALLENLSMTSEQLMESLLELPSDPSAYLRIGSSNIIPHLRAATLSNDILPVLCGSAMKNIGTSIVMDYIGEVLSSPVDTTKDALDHGSFVHLLAWKVTRDSRKGWMTFVRVYSGTLNRQRVLLNTTQNQRERVSKLLLLYASQPEEVDELCFGDVGVILGLRHTRTGDTLVSAYGFPKFDPSGESEAIIPTSAVISASIIPQSHSDVGPVQDALQSLVRTDPSVRVESQEGQLLVHGLGALHLEIVESRLRDEWNVRFELGRRRVSYREGLGPGKPRAAQEGWTTEVSGRPVVATLSLYVRAMHENEKADPAWNGNLILGPDSKPLPVSDVHSSDPLAHIACGISSALSTSPNTTLCMSQIFIQVRQFHLPWNAPPSVLAGVAAVTLREHLRDAGIGPLLEPYVRLKISITEDSLGKVVKDLTENDGEVQDLTSHSSRLADGEEDTMPFSKDGVYIPPDWLSPSSAFTTDGQPPRAKQIVTAIAPLSKMLNYSNRLRTLSGGYGAFETVNVGYRTVSESRRLEILKEMGLRCDERKV